jgi:CBS domain-containing protein
VDVDDLKKLEEFSEQGRGLPIALSRPAAALPFSPISRHCYAMTPLARLGWAQGTVAVADVALVRPHALQASASLAEVAQQMLRDDSDFVCVCDGDRFIGAVYVEALLNCVADDRSPPQIAKLVSTQIPTCAPKSALVDAVRQMLACYLREIPVVGDDGTLVGQLTLSEAAAAGERDPAIDEVLAHTAASPSFFAHRWR